MTHFAKRIELEALVTEREGMVALNLQEYTRAEFAALASRIRALAAEEPEQDPVTEPAPPQRVCDTCIYLNVPMHKSPCSECRHSEGSPSYRYQAAQSADSDPCGCEEAEGLKRYLDETWQAAGYTPGQPGHLPNVVKALVHQRDLARAEVERLRQVIAGVWSALGYGACEPTPDSLANEVAYLKRDRDAAREQLPAWAKPVMHGVSEYVTTCKIHDNCTASIPRCVGHILCDPFAALTPDQRRQCEEP